MIDRSAEAAGSRVVREFPASTEFNTLPCSSTTVIVVLPKFCSRNSPGEASETLNSPPVGTDAKVPSPRPISAGPWKTSIVREPHRNFTASFWSRYTSWPHACRCACRVPPLALANSPFSNASQTVTVWSARSIMEPELLPSLKSLEKALGSVSTWSMIPSPSLSSGAMATALPPSPRRR